MPVGQPFQNLMRKTKNPLISLIVPVFNEEESIELFLETVSKILDPEGLSYEFLFINDGSTDNTLQILLERSRINPSVNILDLSRNFGKEAALTAGIDYAKGDVMVPIDVDLQDPPELIIQFVKFWREGYDVVYGLRASRKGDDFKKQMSAGMFYRLFNLFSPIHIPENAGDYRLFDRRVAEVLKLLPEKNRFMKGLFAWAGFRSIGVTFDRPQRQAGHTTWNYWRLWNFALDGIVSFSTLPLRVWSYVGFFIALFSFFYGAFILTKTLIMGIDLPGYASLMTVVLFLGGVQLFSIGILGEYLGRLVKEAKARPIYVIDKVYQSGIEKEDYKQSQ